MTLSLKLGRITCDRCFQGIWFKFHTYKANNVTSHRCAQAQCTRNLVHKIYRRRAVIINGGILLLVFYAVVIIFIIVYKIYRVGSFYMLPNFWVIGAVQKSRNRIAYRCQLCKTKTPFRNFRVYGCNYIFSICIL